MAFCSRWCSNQEWRSIGADTVYNFSPKGKNNKRISLKLGNQALNEVSGITLDKSLKFNTHNTYKKALHGLRGLILAKKIFTYKAKSAIDLIYIHISPIEE